MIDIHSHILPGLDDGIRDVKESIQLGIEYQRYGIRSVIATPHIKDGQSPYDRTAIITAVENLNLEFALAGLNVDVYTGAEYYMDIRVLKDFENDALITLGRSRFVLLEFPYYHVPKYAGTIVELLLKNGYTPVLAHPERCRHICTKDIHILDWYTSKGCRIQVDAASLTGTNGRSTMKAAWKLYDAGLIDVIATDAHRPIAVEKTLKSLEQLMLGAGKQPLKRFFEVDDLFLSSGDLKLST